MALLIAVVVGAGSEALAQQPSQAQLNAIRQSCRSDYMAHCSSISPGGPAALNCLKQNLSSLSTACQQAVNAIASAAPAAAPAPPPDKPPTTPERQAAPPPAPPAAPAPPPADGKQPSQAQLAAIRQACPADYRLHCDGIPPGGADSLACLKRNVATLSAACQQAVNAVASAAPAAPPAPTPAEPPPLLVTPLEELRLLRLSCRDDVVRFCRGLLPGGGRIASCLHYYSANLSPECSQAISALREGR